MIMERLTSKRARENASQDLASEMGYSHIWKRLAEIEDILGDTYDLDRLRELVEADREGRCVVLSDDGDYIPRQAVIDLLYYYADEACSAVVAEVERIPGIYLGFAQTQKR